MRAEGLSPHGWGNTYGWHEHGYEKVLYCVRGRIVFHSPRSAAAAVGVAGGHQGGDGGLAGLDIPLQGGEPFVAADGHEQGSADVLVAEVGEP